MKANVIDLVYGMIVYKRVILNYVYKWTNIVICYIVNCISYIHGLVETFYGFYIALAQTHFED